MAQGVYLSGQVVVASNTILYVASDATLLASANHTDYPSNQDLWAFVYAQDATNVTITGGGIIDGQQALYVGGWNAVGTQLVPVVRPGRGASLASVTCVHCLQPQA